MFPPFILSSLPSIDKDTYGFDGQKNAHAASKPLPIHKVLPAGFSLPERISAPAKLLAPDSDGFLCDFWFLSRRRADARQGEKDKKHPAHSMQSPAKWVCMEKEEGDCLVQLLPQGGSGTAQASSDVVRRVCSCQLMVSFLQTKEPNKMRAFQPATLSGSSFPHMNGLPSE